MAGKGRKEGAAGCSASRGERHELEKKKTLRRVSIAHTGKGRKKVGALGRKRKKKTGLCCQSREKPIFRGKRGTFPPGRNRERRNRCFLELSGQKKKKVHPHPGGKRRGKSPARKPSKNTKEGKKKIATLDFGNRIRLIHSLREGGEGREADNTMNDLRSGGGIVRILSLRKKG